jgi:type I restriction enzyme M protein
MDAAEYKHVALGLIFSNTSPMPSTRSTRTHGASQGADLGDPDEYRADNIFRVPPEARQDYSNHWRRSRRSASSSTS